MDARAQEVVAFWRAAGPQRWYAKDDAFDADFRNRFLDLHFAAARRELESWLGEPEPALALLILLDQFPRNCFRGTAHMFATDPLARHYAGQVIEAGHDQAVEYDLRVFFFLPFMHSESIAAQERAVRLCSGLDENVRKSADEHRDIIARFGRFPHRNPALGRETSEDERIFLDGGGFSG